MTARTAIKGIGKYAKALNKLSEEKGISRLYLYPDCLWSWVRHGCVLNHYTEGKFYQRKEFERTGILTYRRWKKLLTYNNREYGHILGNKLDFCSHFKEFIGREYLSSANMTYDDFTSFLQRYRKVFVKPVDGLEGRGIHTIQWANGQQNRQHYEALRKGNYIIEEPVVQHSDMVFGNQSVNTVRVYTIYDKRLKRGLCIATTLRAGVGEAIVDNSHSGGLSYEIDMETGRIDSKAWGHQNGGGIFHPYTHICMLGREIPYWEKVLELCQQAAAIIPEIAFIGWDVAITPSGPILIEGNHDPDLDIMEFVGNYGYYHTIMTHLK